MKDFIIVHMVDPIQVGARFTMWPLHMTLLPWFEAPDLQVVEGELRKRLADVKPFQVNVGERASGIGRQPAMFITNTPQLQHLHERLVQTVADNHWNLKGRYTGKLFKPHVTQKAGRDASGTLDVREVYIAEAQSQGYRQIVGKVALG